MEVSMSKTRRGKYTDNRICYISKCKGDMRLYLRRKGKLPCFSYLVRGKSFSFYRGKIRNLKTPLHTFSYFLTLSHTFSHFLILGSLWFAEKIDNIGGLHRCEFLAVLAVSALTELLQKVGISLNPTHQVGTCHHW